MARDGLRARQRKLGLSQEDLAARLELVHNYGSPRHVSRVQRMHDRLVTASPRSEPRLVELREALAAS